MISLDTETTGLFVHHGCTTFAIGIYNGENSAVAFRPVNPLTRTRYSEFAPEEKALIREAFDTDLIAIHNSEFDIAALVEAGVFRPEEPDQPEFWERIVDTTILSHLHHNTDKRSLKDLTPQYLDRGYESEDELRDLVNQCRNFVKTRRPDWMISSEKCPQLRPTGSKKEWWKSDMWLPNRVCHEFRRQEVEAYGIDWIKASRCLNNYLVDDCVNTYDLALAMMNTVIEEYGESVTDMLKTNNQILHVIYKMQRHGTPVHRKELDNSIQICEQWINRLTKETESLVDVEHITDDKLRTILFDKLGFESVKQTKGGKSGNVKDSVSADVLINLKRQCLEDDSISAIGNEFITKILALRKYDKKLGYLKSYERNMLGEKMYVTYNIVGTDTLRMSAKLIHTVNKTGNPYEDEKEGLFDDIKELLDQSPHLRSTFGPEAGRWWLLNDYSQLQLRIFAVVTQEQGMIDAFARGWDAHDYTARKIFRLSDKEKPSSFQRRVAKNVNFGFIFGASAKKIEQTAGIPGLWDTVCEMFPNAHDFIQSQKDTLKAGGYVRTLGGYPLDVPMKDVKWKVEAEKAAHAAVCYIVQGSEGEIVKAAMRDCDDYLVGNYSAGRMVEQVHDEIGFDMPAKFPKVHARNLNQIMVDAAAKYGVFAPVNSELVTYRWDQCKKLIL